MLSFDVSYITIGYIERIVLHDLDNVKLLLRRI